MVRRLAPFARVPPTLPGVTIDRGPCPPEGFVYARVTQFEIDTVAISVPAALDRFRELILPAVRQQPGYEGVLLLHNPEGRGIIVSLWASEQAATAGEISGYYSEQVGKFVTFYRQLPGREDFEVGYLETHAPTPS